MSVVRADQVPYERASPWVLAQTPPTLPEPANDLDDWEWNTVFTKLESRLGALRTWRYSWWAYWATLARFLLPRRYHWLVTANLMSRGNPINQEIIDNTAGLAKDICAAGLVDGMMPTTRKWFKFGVNNKNFPKFQPDAAALVWFQGAEEQVELMLAGSNFYPSMAQAAEDEVVFGTAVVIMNEDFEDGVRCYVPCAGEYYLATGARLSNDSMYREFTFTVNQIVEFFGLEACPPQVRSLWDTAGASLENEYVVAHAIEPNSPMSSAGGTGPREIEVVKGGFPYREIYWLKGVKTPQPLSKRGYWEKPFAVARWKTTSNDAYGRGPGMDALGDIMQLQRETARKGEAIEKMVRPPMVAPVSMKNEPASILPGHITYSDTAGNTGFRPAFEVKPDLAALKEDLKEIQTRIDRDFLVDVFQVINQMEGVQPRNNMEIAQRKGEALQRLGPVIGLWKTEFAGPLLFRAISIAHRRGQLPPLPPSLKGLFAEGFTSKVMKVDYIDMVTLAQISAETAGMEQTFAVAGKLAEAAQVAGEPSPLLTINLGKSLRRYAEKTNFPEDCLYTDQEVQQMAAAKAKAQQAQQMAAAAPQLVQAAQGLSGIPVGGGQSALSAMTGLPAPGLSGGEVQTRIAGKQ